MNNYEIQKALVQNYGYKLAKFGKLPTVDFVYPEYTANGNSEAFRFSPELRTDLKNRSDVIYSGLRNKKIVWGFNEEILRDLDKNAPRLGIADLIDGKINSIYSYRQFLVIGADETTVAPYLVKPVIDGRMAWFELTSPEKSAFTETIQKKAADKPYRTLMQRLFAK